MDRTTASFEIVTSSGRGRSGDIPEQAWQIVEKHRAELIHQAFQILGNHEDAEDVVQETFCDAVRDPAKLSHARSLGAWLRAINRCNALNRSRGRRSDSSRLQARKNLEPESTFTTGGFSILELRDTVDKALEGLPEDLQVLIRLRHFEHLSYKDIAGRLQIPIGNVGGLLMDASVRLYARLKRQLETAPREGMTRTRVPQVGEIEELPTQNAKGI